MKYCNDLVSVPDAGAHELLVQTRDFEAARSRIRPSALREVAVEVANVHWDDVGGLDGIKQRLKVLSCTSLIARLRLARP